jgi:hypothetical protein
MRSVILNMLVVAVIASAVGAFAGWQLHATFATQPRHDACTRTSIPPELVAQVAQQQQQQQQQQRRRQQQQQLPPLPLVPVQPVLATQTSLDPRELAKGKPGHPLLMSDGRWMAGTLHRNCYQGRPDVADPFFTFFADYQFHWHDAWWATNSNNNNNPGHLLNVRTFDADAGSAVPVTGAKGTLTLFIVAGMLQYGQTMTNTTDPLPETYTESVALLNSIFLLATGPIELVIATDLLGLGLYSALFKQVSRTKQQIDVILMPVRDTWIANLATQMNYSLLTHHSGMWGTLKMFAHLLPIFAKRDSPIVVVDTDMIFLTDPMGLVAHFPAADAHWQFRMPLYPDAEDKLSASAHGDYNAICSCIVIQNLGELHRNDPYPDFFVTTLKFMDARHKGWSTNGLFTPPHGDQGVYTAIRKWEDAQNDPSHRIIHLMDAWNRDLCHEYK